MDSIREVLSRRRALAGWLAAAAAPLALAAGVVAVAAPEGAGPPAVPAAALAQGEALFKAHCASCHDPATGRAPDRAQLDRLGTLEVLNALLNGSMRPMAQGLTTKELGEIAVYASPPKTQAAAAPPPDPPKCATVRPFAPHKGEWPSWGLDPANRRSQTAGVLSPSEVARLKVKWAFVLAGGKEGQPTVAGGRVFLTSFQGNAYALDAASGCLIWRIDAAHSRTTIAIAPLAASPSGWAAFYGDQAKKVHAVDAADGKSIWASGPVETHPLAILTGAPVVAGGRVYQPISSFEEVTAGAATYPCCTFRGAVAALDAASGKPIWKTPVIDQPPAPTGKNAAGTQMFGPAGGAIWSSPTIDLRRGLLFVATGDSYTDVKEDGSDSVMAMDLATGQVKWRTQVTTDDNYMSGCETAPLANCPKKLGHDFDFGAPPVLARLAGGKDVLLAGQKSGAVYGLDPDSGHVLWKTQVGAGGALGGVEWGMASDGTRLYVGVADAFMASPPGRPGLVALDPATGRELWRTTSPHLPCAWAGGAPCLNGISAPPTAVPGLVFAGDMNGRLRAYRADTGKVVWEVDTGAQTFVTANGVSVPGGNIDGPGPVVADGRLYVMSGYQSSLGGPGTSVLVVYSPDGR
jgi:polyvinyl alcohol dehydrogenase (cytochrome)